MKKFFSMLLALGLCVGFAAGARAADDKPAANDEIVLGSIWDQVGIAAPVGQSALRGSQVAIELLNEEGGIFGRPVRLYNIDAQSDPTLIANAAVRLANELKVPAAMGLEDDSLASAAGPIFQKEGTVLLVGTATTPSVPGMGDYVFLNAFGDDVQGKAAAKYAASNLGWKKVAVIWDSASAYSTDITKFFVDAFKEYTNDPDAIVHEEMYQTGDTNFTAQLTRLKQALAKQNIDGILLAPPFPQDAPIIAKQMASLGIKLPVLLTDGGDDQSVIEVGGPAVEGFIVSTHFAADNPMTDNGNKFVAKYREMFKAEPGAFESLGYDAVRTLAEAIASIGQEKWDSMDLAAKRAAIRDAIQNTKFTTTTLPKSYPDPATAKYPRVSVKPIIFKVFKDNDRVFHGSVQPEDL